LVAPGLLLFLEKLVGGQKNRQGHFGEVPKR